MLAKIIFVCFFLIVVTLSACSDPDKIIKINGNTMGTQYHISIVSTLDNNQIKPSELQHEIELLLTKVNQQMSTYQADSEISTFNHYNKTDWFGVSKDFAFVVATAQQISIITQGAFDITIAPLINLWGFGTEIPHSTPTNIQIKKLIKHTGYKLLNVRINPPALRKFDKDLHIDLSAIAKGFAVDKISNYLKSRGVNNYLVEIGGEIQSRGKNQKGKRWVVAIANPNPEHSTKNQLLKISNQALATSGNYQNYFIKNGVRYSHTLNPRTGYPIKHKLASVTVVHSSTMMADAFATAIMVMGEIKGEKFAQDKNLKVNLIYKDKGSFKTWQNIH